MPAQIYEIEGYSPSKWGKPHPFRIKFEQKADPRGYDTTTRTHGPRPFPYLSIQYLTEDGKDNGGTYVGMWERTSKFKGIFHAIPERPKFKEFDGKQFSRELMAEKIRQIAKVDEDWSTSVR